MQYCENESVIINNPFLYSNCVACDSQYVFKLRDVGCARTKKNIPLLCCLLCNTLSCIGDYKEDESQLKADIEYNINNLSNEKDNMYNKFIKDLGITINKHSNKNITDFLVGEVGCNIGTLVNVLNNLGIKTIGYDINKYAIDYGLSYYNNIDIRNKLFGSDKDLLFDFVISNDTFEHLSNPRNVLSDIIKNIKQNGYIYITVPIVDKTQWSFLKDDTEKMKTFDISSPFRDNDVHIVHFSIKGLELFGTTMGLKIVSNFININNIYENWPLNGILFQK